MRCSLIGMTAKEAILNKDLLFDTGVAKSIFSQKRPALEEAFWRSVLDRNFCNVQNAFVLSTPLLLLECAGLKAEDFDPYVLDSFNDKAISQIKSRSLEDIEFSLGELMNYLIDWHRSSPQLSSERLAALIDSEMKLRSPYGQLLFDGLFSQNLRTAEKYDSFIRRLTFYRLLQINYRGCAFTNTDILKIDRALMGYFRNLLLNDYRGYAFGKVADDLLTAAFQAKGKQRPKTYSAESELFDPEIVHLATVGSFQSGKHNAVAVFTTEKLSTWKRRLGDYLDFLEFLLEGSQFTIRPGLIFQVDQTTGTLREDHIDVLEELRPRIQNLGIGQDTYLNSH